MACTERVHMACPLNNILSKCGHDLGRFGLVMVSIRCGA